IVSGVGHETDFTICDFVADVRAPTPTAAAALVVPERGPLAHRLRSIFAGLTRAGAYTLGARAQRLDQATRRLVHPAARLSQPPGGAAGPARPPTRRPRPPHAA